jgi:putative endonuclease
MPSFVYILAAKNPDGRAITYVGWTLDLDRRLAEHNGGAAGSLRGAKTTRGRMWTLVYAEKHRTRKAAMRREWTLKCDRKFRASLRQGWDIVPTGDLGRSTG